MKRKYLILIIAIVITVSASINFFMDKGEQNTNPVLISHRFNNSDDYINFIESEVQLKGINLAIVTLAKGDNYWKISKKHSVNIDTLIGANPHWNSLNAKTNQRIVVPSETGVLHFIEKKSDLQSILQLYSCTENDIVIQELPFFHSISSKFSDNAKPIAIFIKNRKPLASNMNAKLANDYKLREMFRSPLGGRYSSYFGNRRDPVTLNTSHFHNGVDIAAPYGTPVGASRAGTVSSAGWMGGYGKAVIIEHSDGFRTLYGHLSSISVRPGAKVKAGSFIGRVGSTGYSTGPHLHFTLWKNNSPLNPMKVLW